MRSIRANQTQEDKDKEAARKRERRALMKEIESLTLKLIGLKKANREGIKTRGIKSQLVQFKKRKGVSTQDLRQKVEDLKQQIETQELN